MLSARMKRHRERKENEMLLEEDDDVSLSDDTAIVEQELCQNCQRSELVLCTVVKQHVHFGRKWCLLKKKKEVLEYRLCSECQSYCVKKKHFDEKEYIWPTFIYITIFNHRQKAWDLLPDTLRRYWYEAIEEFTDIDRLPVQSKMRDATQAKKEMTDVLNNLGSIGWSKFKKTWEQYQTIPFVRCPWGCSEYYPKCNNIPFDVFISFHLECSLKLYSTQKQCSCTRGFRKDTMYKVATILNNPQWPCVICVEMVQSNRC